MPSATPRAITRDDLIDLEEYGRTRKDRRAALVARKVQTREEVSVDWGEHRLRGHYPIGVQGTEDQACLGEALHGAKRSLEGLPFTEELEGAQRGGLVLEPQRLAQGGGGAQAVLGEREYVPRGAAVAVIKNINCKLGCPGGEGSPNTVTLDVIYKGTKNPKGRHTHQFTKSQAVPLGGPTTLVQTHQT